MGDPKMLAYPQGRRWYDMIQSGKGADAAMEIVVELARDRRDLVPGSQIAIELESRDRSQRRRGRDPQECEHQGHAPVHWSIRDLRDAHFNNRRR